MKCRSGSGARPSMRSCRRIDQALRAFACSRVDYEQGAQRAASRIAGRAMRRRRPKEFGGRSAVGRPPEQVTRNMHCPSRVDLPIGLRRGHATHLVARAAALVVLMLMTRAGRDRRHGSGPLTLGHGFARLMPPMFHLTRDALYSRLRRAAAFAPSATASRRDPRRIAPIRVSNGQQNAYRCCSPGRNPGSGASW